MFSNFDGDIRPGDLRHRVEVQREVVEPGALGVDVKTWSTLGTFWARVRPLTGRELILAQQVNATLSHEVTFRNVGGIGSLSVTTQDRLKWGTHVLNIDSIVEANGYNEYYKVMCMEMM